jgi:beta-glucosidase
VTLAPGHTRTVSFKLPASALAYWDASTHAWVVEPGAVELQVGASSSDIRVRRQIDVGR